MALKEDLPDGDGLARGPEDAWDESDLREHEGRNESGIESKASSAPTFLRGGQDSDESTLLGTGESRDAMPQRTMRFSPGPELLAEERPSRRPVSGLGGEHTMHGGSDGTARSYSDAPPPDGYIDKYEVIRQLGEGGMGVVYLARDNRLGRRVAIKVLRTDDPELTRRFIVEARTTARCTHENIVVIHEAGEHAGSPFMVLEFLEGKALSDYMERDPPTVPHAVEIMVSVVRALVKAHEEGIVHRDLKPDNIFITDSGTVKVLDFGIAKLLRRDLASSSSGAERSLSSTGISGPVPHRTRGTGIAGTLGYMAPEQWHAPNTIDHRADIWAVGATLFELITRRNPLLEFSTAMEVAAFLGSDAPMPSVRDFGVRVPDELASVIARCLEKDPTLRFPDARSLLKALEPFLPGRRHALEGQIDVGPFAGLRAFQEEDATRFFGRSRELGTLLGRLRETPLMATVGPSGAGKSSFLRAGVIPALKNSGERWEVLICRPGRNPLESLEERLSFLGDRASFPPPSGRGRALQKRLEEEPGFVGATLRARARDRETKILLFVDQFEELYTLGTSTEERRLYTAALLSAADDASSPVRVMLSIRADFLGRTTEDPDFVTTLTKGLFFLGPPSEEGLREALVRPAEMVGYRFESNAIVDEMVAFLGGSPSGLPLLQFTAAQLWDARDPQRRLLTLSSYKGMGGVDGALVSHADRVYAGLPAAQQQLCRTLFMHLVTPEKTRAIRSMSELLELSGEPDALKSLVEQLVESRLWVVTTRKGDATVEIVHESLISNWPALARWLDESHEDTQFVDQLVLAAQQWSQKGRDPGLLWRGEMVAELDAFLRRYRGALPEGARQFTAAAKQLTARSARLRQAALAGVVTGLVLVAVLAVGALVVVDRERRNADRNAEIAEQRLADQLRAEERRTAAELERKRAEERRQKAEQKTDLLEDKVKLDAVLLAKKNVELESALAASDARRIEAQEAQKRAETSEREAKAATERANHAAEEAKRLLDKERARAERLDAQLGALVEDLK